MLSALVFILGIFIANAAHLPEVAETGKDAAVILPNEELEDSFVSKCAKAAGNTNALTDDTADCIADDVNSALHDLVVLLGGEESVARRGAISADIAAAKACGHIKNKFKKAICWAKVVAHVAGQICTAVDC